MKRLFALILALVMALSLVACGSTDPKSPDANDGASLDDLDPITITLADTVAETESGTKAGMAFAKAINEKSNGKITIEYKASGQLGTFEETTEAMSLGQLDMARLDLSYMGAYCPESQLLFLPFLIKDYEHFEKILASDYIDKMEEQLDNYNIHVLDYVSAGFRLILTKSPITEPANCKDILFRSPGSQVYLDTFSTLGFNPVTIPFTEVYTALQSGVVDGTDNSVPVAADGEYYKLCPYVCRSNHMFSFTVFCVGTEFWESLPEAYRTIMSECINEACTAQRANAETLENEYYEKMEADGATITTWSNPDELVELFRPYWDKTAESYGGWSADFVKECINLM